ncbi:putative CHY zinc finger domain protein [Blattamonas nauphoetae]|uniref:CHY zinc finger domain protein n=1 Tax=Blattamonas nauphoetae TaxID=2049346 RepID=A0ABQ9Y4M2_9EUKA|nr:putative CHY zinc finger domain protein [Blattamonas nauphoetae]
MASPGGVRLEEMENNLLRLTTIEAALVASSPLELNTLQAEIEAITYQAPSSKSIRSNFTAAIETDMICSIVDPDTVASSLGKFKHSKARVPLASRSLMAPVNISDNSSDDDLIVVEPEPSHDPGIFQSPHTFPAERLYDDSPLFHQHRIFADPRDPQVLADIKLRPTLIPDCDTSKAAQKSPIHQAPALAAFNSDQITSQMKRYITSDFSTEVFRIFDRLSKSLHSAPTAQIRRIVHAGFSSVFSVPINDRTISQFISLVSSCTQTILPPLFSIMRTILHAYNVQKAQSEQVHLALIRKYAEQAIQDNCDIVESHRGGRYYVPLRQWNESRSLEGICEWPHPLPIGWTVAEGSGLPRLFRRTKLVWCLSTQHHPPSHILPPLHLQRLFIRRSSALPSPSTTATSATHSFQDSPMKMAHTFPPLNLATLPLHGWAASLVLKCFECIPSTSPTDILNLSGLLESVISTFFGETASVHQIQPTTSNRLLSTGTPFTVPPRDHSARNEAGESPSTLLICNELLFLAVHLFHSIAGLLDTVLMKVCDRRYFGFVEGKHEIHVEAEYAKMRVRRSSHIPLHLSEFLAAGSEQVSPHPPPLLPSRPSFSSTQSPLFQPLPIIQLSPPSSLDVLAAVDEWTHATQSKHLLDLNTTLKSRAFAICHPKYPKAAFHHTHNVYTNPSLPTDKIGHRVRLVFHVLERIATTGVYRREDKERLSRTFGTILPEFEILQSHLTKSAHLWKAIVAEGGASLSQYLFTLSTSLNVTRQKNIHSFHNAFPFFYSSAAANALSGFKGYKMTYDRKSHRLTTTPFDSQYQHWLHLPMQHHLQREIIRSKAFIGSTTSAPPFKMTLKHRSIRVTPPRSSSRLVAEPSESIPTQSNRKIFTTRKSQSWLLPLDSSDVQQNDKTSHSSRRKSDHRRTILRDDVLSPELKQSRARTPPPQESIVIPCIIISSSTSSFRLFGNHRLLTTTLTPREQRPPVVRRLKKRRPQPKSFLDADSDDELFIIQKEEWGQMMTQHSAVDVTSDPDESQINQTSTPVPTQQFTTIGQCLCPTSHTTAEEISVRQLTASGCLFHPTTAIHLSLVDCQHYFVQGRTHNDHPVSAHPELILEELQTLKDTYKIKILKKGGWPISFKILVPPPSIAHLDLDNFEVIFTIRDGYPSVSSLEIQIVNTDIPPKVNSLLSSALLNQANLHLSLSHPIIPSLVGWLNSQAVIVAIAPYTETYYTTQADGSTERRVTFSAEVESQAEISIPQKKKKKKGKPKKAPEMSPAQPTSPPAQQETHVPSTSSPPLTSNPPPVPYVSPDSPPLLPISSIPLPDLHPDPAPSSPPIQPQQYLPPDHPQLPPPPVPTALGQIVLPKVQSTRCAYLPHPLLPDRQNEMHLVLCTYDYPTSPPPRIRRMVPKMKLPPSVAKPSFPDRFVRPVDTDEELEFSLPLLPTDPDFPFYKYPTLQFSHFSFILTFKLHFPLDVERVKECFERGLNNQIECEVTAFKDTSLTDAHLSALSFFLRNITFNFTLMYFHDLPIEPFPPFRRIIHYFERHILSILANVDASLEMQKAGQALTPFAGDEVPVEVDEDGEEAKAEREALHIFLSQYTVQQDPTTDADESESEDEESDEEDPDESDVEDDVEEVDVFEYRKHALTRFGFGRLKEADIRQFIARQQKKIAEALFKPSKERIAITKLDYDDGESLYDKKLKEVEKQHAQMTTADSDSSEEEAEESNSEDVPISSLPEISSSQPQRPVCTLKLDGLVLQHISLIRLSVLTVAVQCHRCLNLNRIQLPHTHFSQQFAFDCQRCHNTLHITFHSSPVHEFSQILGFFTDCARCMPVDYLPSSWMGTCSNCSKDASFVNVGQGEQARKLGQGFAKDEAIDEVVRTRSTGRVCLKCYAQMTFVFDDVIFLDNHGNQIRQIVRTEKKPKIKNQMLGFRLGQTLPKNGACRHFGHSYRWYRFPCCGKIYPCESCHDQEEDHPALWAKRMICGYCAKEQLVANDCRNCGKTLSRPQASLHWEGGKGQQEIHWTGKDRVQKKATTREKTQMKAVSLVEISHMIIDPNLMKPFYKSWFDLRRASRVQAAMASQPPNIPYPPYPQQTSNFFVESLLLNIQLLKKDTQTMLDRLSWLEAFVQNGIASGQAQMPDPFAHLKQTFPTIARPPNAIQSLHQSSKELPIDPRSALPIHQNPAQFVPSAALPGQKSTPVTSTSPPPHSGTRLVQKVHFDERLIEDATELGFTREAVIDALNVLFQMHDPCNDLDVLHDKLIEMQNSSKSANP